MKDATNVLNKEPVDIATATGTLRKGTSIVDPVIVFDSYLENDFIAVINYMYIAAFKRYYYINDIAVSQNHLWTVSGHCDVLMSHKEQILLNSGIIKRQQERWDLYLDDGTFRSDQDPLIGIRAFPDGFNAYEWVLAVAGNQSST